MVTNPLDCKICLILPHLRYVRLIVRTEVLGVLAIQTMKILIKAIKGANLRHWQWCSVATQPSPPKTIAVGGREFGWRLGENCLLLLRKKLWVGEVVILGG